MDLKRINDHYNTIASKVAGSTSRSQAENKLQNHVHKHDLPDIFRVVHKGNGFEVSVDTEFQRGVERLKG